MERNDSTPAARSRINAPMRDFLRVVSWNVNGIRSCVRKGFVDWLEQADADFVALQEVRALPDEIPPGVLALPGWHFAWTPAERRGYSGVGMLSRMPADGIETSLGEAQFDREGRLQILHFRRLTLVNGYFPKGSGNDRDNSRVPYKLEFYRTLFERVQRLRGEGRRVLVLGDFNTAHREIDLARPKDNRETSGFLPEERAELDRWIAAGWIDTFREFESGGGHYSWWSQRFGVRARNIGWRIDYVLCSPDVRPFLRGAFLLPDVTGSDHCPAGVTLAAEVLG